MRKSRIVFWPHTLNSNVASYRIRCKLIVEELKKIDDNNVYAISEKVPQEADILILSKRYDKDSIRSAVELREKYGTKLFLDICDNHFIDEHKSKELQVAIDKVDHIISSTEFLKSIITTHTNRKDIQVIGDITEHSNLKKGYYLLRVFYLWKIQFFKWKIKKTNPITSKRLVWYGNHQGSIKDSGMSDLNLIRKELEELYREEKISLTIISNSYKRYRDIFKDWNLETIYVPWDKISFENIFKIHSTSIIPVSKNKFTYSKTDNRVTLSLYHGLQVVADPIPSYIQHADKIFLSDWKNSLKSIVTLNRRKQIGIDILKMNKKIINSWKETLLS